MPAASRRRRNGGWFGSWERRDHALLPMGAFLRRVVFNLTLGVGFIAASLLVGMAGYAYFEGLGTVDSFLNAAMILSGMGPVAEMHTEAGKVFAGSYALYSGLAVLAAAGLVFAPVLHRLLHHFHADDQDLNPDQPAKETRKR
jgi:hypothetical protein